MSGRRFTCALILYLNRKMACLSINGQSDFDFWSSKQIQAKQEENLQRSYGGRLRLPSRFFTWYEVCILLFYIHNMDYISLLFLFSSLAPQVERNIYINPPYNCQMFFVCRSPTHYIIHIIGLLHISSLVDLKFGLWATAAYQILYCMAILQNLDSLFWPMG